MLEVWKPSDSSLLSSLVGGQVDFDIAPRRQLVWNPVLKQLLKTLFGPLGTNPVSNLVNSEVFCFQVCLILCFVQIEPVGFVLMCS